MVTLAEAKLHLRVDHADEDMLIQSYLDAAALAVENYCGITFADPPAPVRAAVLLLAADLYEQREISTTAPLRENATFGRLLNPYRVLAVA